MKKTDPKPPADYEPQQELQPGQVAGIHIRPGDLIQDAMFEERSLTKEEIETDGVADVDDDDAVDDTD